MAKATPQSEIESLISQIAAKTLRKLPREQSESVLLEIQKLAETLLEEYKSESMGTYYKVTHTPTGQVAPLVQPKYTKGGMLDFILENAARRARGIQTAATDPGAFSSIRPPLPSYAAAPATLEAPQAAPGAWEPVTTGELPVPAGRETPSLKGRAVRVASRRGEAMVPGLDLPGLWENTGFTPDVPEAVKGSAYQHVNDPENVRTIHAVLRPTIPKAGKYGVPSADLKSLIQLEIPPDLRALFSRLSPQSRRTLLWNFLESKKSTSILGYMFIGGMNVPDVATYSHETKSRFIRGESLKSPPVNPKQMTLDELKQYASKSLRRKQEGATPTGLDTIGLRTTMRTRTAAQKAWNSLVASAKELGLKVSASQVASGDLRKLFLEAEAGTGSPQVAAIAKQLGGGAKAASLKFEQALEKVSSTGAALQALKGPVQKFSREEIFKEILRNPLPEAGRALKFMAPEALASGVEGQQIARTLGKSLSAYLSKSKSVAPLLLLLTVPALWKLFRKENANGIA